MIFHPKDDAEIEFFKTEDDDFQLYIKDPTGDITVIFLTEQEVDDMITVMQAVKKGLVR